MLDQLFKGVFDTEITNVITPSNFLLCVGTALLVGLILTFFTMYHSKSSRGFLATLALLPAAVCVVIMMVNGNVGTGVAVAGAFSLVRFRSAAGSAKEIGAIFLAMACGLMTGMGYLGYAILAAVLLGAISMLYSMLRFEKITGKGLHKSMNITIPEDLDYTDVFDPIIENYTTDYELTQVKTTNMGSLFRLSYDIALKSGVKEKDMIDELRCRNGNLEITVSKQSSASGEL